ncbi:hypothetical protein A2Z53_02100 [Candidatus Giovannonibacteria bacterium RIFCSPHIGHO2_02_42_15]|uniref:Uncharacterized protein n=2 Tax=Candidatus Giovannoniibacteriota TaxID=1752738 RepID=A0A1F5VKJ4_9BACT|nr:MAG: hypothetical protein UV11_C0008G0002 [Candidatus Giovannonibacteria bacterium GW2011_GWF2_42_19]OGF63987.1 MAG: hypothetical protein A2Z53_02100 [Candidatus Giovannonibacteria bacterium RIFCSPHIGHO2_02_42_15]
MKTGVIFSIVALIVVVGAVYFLYVNQTLSPGVSTTTSTQIDTRDWKSYIFEELKMEIKYPARFETHEAFIDEEGVSSIMFGKEAILSLDERVEFANISFAKNLNDSVDAYFESEKRVNISNYSMECIRKTILKREVGVCDKRLDDLGGEASYDGNDYRSRSYFIVNGDSKVLVSAFIPSEYDDGGKRITVGDEMLQKFFSISDKVVESITFK